MNKIRWIIASLFLIFLFPLTQVFAQSVCQQEDPCASKPLQDQPDCYSSVIATCQNASETLTSQINYMNNQIRLTTLQIDTTRINIDKLSNEINELGDEIAKLEDTLNQRLAILIKRIPESYKRSVTPDFGLLLLSSDISDFITRAKYLAKVQAEDAAVLFQVKATQNNYTERKQTREDKKVQLEEAKRNLEIQNNQLTQQKQEKNALLIATQGKEEIYSQLLSQAKAQLAAFQGFISSRGGLSLITADPSWPSAYFSQRDVRWGNQAIAGPYVSGTTVYSIGQAGCLISSVAMALTHRGNSTNPGIIGSNSSYFFNSYFLWSALNSLGFGVQRTIDTSGVDSAISQGKWAIVGISYQDSVYAEPFHFVVVTGKNGSDYNLFDPWEGPYTSFNSKYGSDYITEVITY